MARVQYQTVLVVLIIAGCATSSGPGGSMHQPIGSARVPTAAPRRPSFRVTFKDGFAYATERGRQWRIAEVTRDEMLWAPDGLRFAYALPQQKAKESAGCGAARAGAASCVPGSARKAARQPYQIVVRNIRGDSVNAFPVYRPGNPTELEWIDDNTICYLAPPDKSGSAYVVHAVQSGEILAVHRGESFVWSPGKRRLAYVAGRNRQQVIKVGEEQVWPRQQDRHKRRIVSELVWSPDGAGLAFLEQNGTKSRLVVLLVIDDHNGDLTWELPSGAREGRNKVFWAESKVIIGESTFKPRFAASWTRVR